MLNLLTPTRFTTRALFRSIVGTPRRYFRASPWRLCEEEEEDDYETPPILWEDLYRLRGLMETLAQENSPQAKHEILGRYPDMKPVLQL